MVQHLLDMDCSRWAAGLLRQPNPRVIHYSRAVPSHSILRDLVLDNLIAFSGATPKLEVAHSAWEVATWLTW